MLPVTVRACGGRNRRPRETGCRRVLLAVLALIILLGAAGAVLLGRVDTDFVVRRIAAATAQATGQPLVFASAPHIAFFPPGRAFRRGPLGADPAAAKADEASRAARGPTLTVKGGMAQLEWAALLAGKVVVREVRLDNPVLRLDATAFAARAPHETSLAPAAAPQAAREQPGALPVELDRLVLRQGSVLWTDAAGRTAQIDSINFSLENLRQGQEATLQCDFVFSLSQQAVGGSEPTAVGSGSTAPAEETAAARPAAALTGTLALSAKLSYAPPQLLFRQASVTVTPLGGPLPEKAGPLQLAVEGALLPLDAAGPLLRLDKARLTTPQAHAEARGNVRLTPLAANVDVTVEAAPRALAALWGRTFKPASAGDKDALTAAARIAYAPHVLTINDLKARWDAATLTGTARLTPAGRRPGGPQGRPARGHPGPEDSARRCRARRAPDR